MDWRRWASIARLTIRKMCCLNGSRKLLTQKIMMVDIMTGFGSAYFLHKVQFFAGIGPAHFPAETTRPLGRGCLPFSPKIKNLSILVKMASSLSNFRLFRPFVLFRNYFLIHIIYYRRKMSMALAPTDQIIPYCIINKKVIRTKCSPFRGLRVFAALSDVGKSEGYCHFFGRK